MSTVILERSAGLAKDIGNARRTGPLKEMQIDHRRRLYLGA